MDNVFSNLRLEIKRVGEMVLLAKAEINPSNPLPEEADVGEMIANITLAYRHIEDASMRVGKAIQAFEGGKSIYDNNDTARAAVLKKGKDPKSTE